MAAGDGASLAMLRVGAAQQSEAERRVYGVVCVDAKHQLVCG